MHMSVLDNLDVIINQHIAADTDQIFHGNDVPLCDKCIVSHVIPSIGERERKEAGIGNGSKVADLLGGTLSQSKLDRASNRNT